jgi:ABC-type transporter Mla subunit MlaD
MRGGRIGSLAASPTLVGAVTVLVIVVAVFLTYQANQGLPFVPTYKLSAELPNANTLVPGNEVRIGGNRVGQIRDITPQSDPDTGAVSAVVDMELNQDLDPLPEDTTMVVRSRSRSASSTSSSSVERPARVSDGGTIPSPRRARAGRDR